MRKAGVRINTAGSKINKSSIFNPNAAWNHNQRLTHTDNKKVDVDVELLNFMNPGETFLTKTKDYEKLYKMKTGQNVQKKAMPLREMIINTDKHVTMQNLAYLTQKIEKLTGWKALHIAHHKDEGHFDKDTGIFKTNYHAHVVWECYDKETAKSRLLTPKQMSTLQDLASIHLSMERGEKNSNKIHLEPEQYRQQQTIIETIKIQSEKKISKAVENIEEQHSEDMRIVKILRAEITELKTKTKELTTINNQNFDKLSDIQQLFNAIGLGEISAFVDVDKETIKRAKEIIEEKYKQERENLKASNVAMQQDYKNLKIEKEKNVEIINSYSKNKKDKQIDIG